MKEVSSVGRIYLLVFKYQLTKNGFAGTKGFRVFRETGPKCYVSVMHVCVMP